MCNFEQSDQGVDDSSCIQGKLSANFAFWRDVVRASEFVFDIIQNGYKILFRESRLPFSIENLPTALDRRSFVQGAISELLTVAVLERRRFTLSFATHYTSLCSRQANLDLFWIYLILTSLSLRSLSSTKI